MRLLLPKRLYKTGNDFNSLRVRALLIKVIAYAFLTFSIEIVNITTHMNDYIFVATTKGQ